jgi:hypothetical protein
MSDHFTIVFEGFFALDGAKIGVRLPLSHHLSSSKPTYCSYGKLPISFDDLSIQTDDFP